MKDSLESIIAVWKSISPSAANLQVVPTYNPEEPKKEDNKKSGSKSKTHVPNSHTDLLMSLMQSQQPTPFVSNSGGGHGGSNDSNRDRKVSFILNKMLSISEIYIMKKEKEKKYINLLFTLTYML